MRFAFATRHRSFRITRALFAALAAVAGRTLVTLWPAESRSARAQAADAGTHTGRSDRAAFARDAWIRGARRYAMRTIVVGNALFAVYARCQILCDCEKKTKTKYPR